MKATVLVVLLSVMITAQSFHTINISDGGVNDFTTATERFTTTSGSALYGYLTWDQNYLYIGFSGNSPAGALTDGSRVIHLYFDTDPKQSPKTGNGSSTGESWRFTPALPFNADYHYAFKTSDNTEYKRTYSGGSWQNTTLTTSNYKAAGYWEIRILRSDLGSPKQINFTGYIEEDWGTGFICGGLPSGLFTNNNSGGAITFNNKYLHYNLIDQITPNSSFHNENFSWLVGLKISGSSLTDTSYAGMAGNATDSIDSGTDLVLGSIPANDYLEIYFKHSWGSSRYSRYINALTDISNTQKIWNIEVATDKLNTSFTITPDLWQTIPTSYAVKLKDLTTGEVTNLRSSSYSYTTGSTAEQRQFQLIIGLDGPSVQFTTTSLNFGNIQTDNASFLNNYIKNTGIADLTVTSVTSNSSNFTVTTSTSFTLAPGDSAAVIVKFVPSAIQSFNGTISVASNVNGSPSTFTVSGSGILNSEAVTLPAGWNLVSVPVTPASSSPSAVFGDDADYYLLYSYSSGAYSVPSSVHPKTGYWLGLETADTIDVQGTALTASDSIPLSQSWNLVSNPFINKFPVNSIRYRRNNSTLTPTEAVSAGWVQHNFVKYSSGSYSSVSDSLIKWEGYFFNTLLSDVTIVFDRSLGGNADNYHEPEITAENWRIPIQAAINTATDRYLYIGTSPDATNGFDIKYDFFKPPVVPGNDWVETWLSVPGSQEKFSHDIREPLVHGQSSHQWGFVVRSGVTGTVTLGWEGIFSALPDYIKENFSFSLSSSLTGTVDMLSETSVAFTAEANNEYPFFINPIPSAIPGNKNEEKGFILEQNYPNPFNPETIIRFSIPETAFTTLTLYDARGKEIKNIFAGYLTPGSHRFLFAAEQLSSGVYFYRLKSGNYNSVKKLIVLR